MKLIVFVATFVSFLPLAAADVMIADNNQTITVDCAKDPNVSIAGNQATVTLTGACKRVSITGNQATVTGSSAHASVAGNNNTANLDGVDTLTTPGNSNTVTWKTTLDKKLKKPRLANFGNKNTITQTM